MSDKEYIYVQSGYPGSGHDSHVFISNETDPCKVLPDSKFHIIRDSAFALAENLMAPYRGTGHLTAIKGEKKNTGTRYVIEMYFDT